MKFYHISIGEVNPDPFSEAIQNSLSRKYYRYINWSHSAILVEGAGEDSGVYESTEPGFHKSSIEVALAGSLIRHKVEIQVVDGPAAVEWLKKFIGTPYSRLGFAVFLPSWLRWVVSKIIPKFILKRFANGRSESFCSESTAWFMRDNCPGALQDNLLSEANCDRVDPVLAHEIAISYRPKLRP